MSVQQHTPGPWGISPDAPGSASLVVRSYADRQVDSSRVAWIPFGPNHKANARLVAAAPKMLEFLKALLADLSSGAFHDAGNEYNWRRELIPLIALAEPEPPHPAEEPPCCICSGPMFVEAGGWRQGHNALPVADGRCCGHCNRNYVVPARIEEMMGRYTGGE